MKKLIFLFVFYLLGNMFASKLEAQTQAQRFVTGKVTHTQTNSDATTFTVSCNFTDEGGLYDGTNVAVNDYLFVSDGGLGYYLPISEIVTPGPVTVVVKVLKTGLSLGAIPVGTGYISKGTRYLEAFPFVSGISNADQQIAMENTLHMLDSVLQYRLPARTTGGTPPGYTPTSNDSWIAQNSDGIIYYWSGSSWLAVFDGVFTAGPITGSGTSLIPLNILSNSITTTHIATGGVATAEILNATILTEDIANNAIDSTKLATNSVQSTDIANGQVWLQDLANNSVDSSRLITNAVQSSDIANGQIWLQDLASNSVDSNKIVNKSISIFDIAQNGATLNQILKWNGSIWLPQADGGGLPSLANGKIWIGNGSNVATEVTPSGDLAISNTGVVEVNSAKDQFAIVDEMSDDAASDRVNWIVSASRVRLNPTANILIQGIAANGGNTGKIIMVTNVNATFKATIKNNGTASVGNKFDINADYDLLPKQSILCVYTNSFWRIIGITGSGNFTDGDKGDVDVTSSLAVLTIDTSAVTSIKIDSNAVTMAKIDQAGATLNQVIKWNGTDWAPANDVGGGMGDNWGTQVVEKDATLVGTGITGNLLGVATNAIDSSRLASNSVQSSDIKDGQVWTVDIADNAITNVKIVDNAIGNAEMLDNAIGSTEIIDGSVALADMANVATGTVFYRKTASTGVPETQSLSTLKADLNLTGNNNGDVTLAGENYLSIAGQVITANAVNLSGTNVNGTLAAARFGALTGDVTNSAGSYATTIANNAVTSAKIFDGTIVSSDISDGTITLIDMAANSIDSNKLIVGAVMSSDITNGQVWSVDLANNAVTSSKIADDAVTNAKIADDAVTNAKIADDAVTSIKIAANTINGTDIALGSDALGDLMYYNGTDWVRKPKGFDGQFLSQASSIPTWVDAPTDLNGIYTADGIIPDGVDAKLITDGTFSIDWSDNTDAIIINDLTSQMLISGDNGSAKITLEDTQVKFEFATKGLQIDNSKIVFNGLPVGIGGNPGSTAAFQVTSTTGSIVPPLMTETQRDAISGASDGSWLYNTTSLKHNFRQNGSWIEISAGAGDNWGSQVVQHDATLTGQGTSGTPLAIADNGVTNIKMADNAIGNAELADDAVNTAEIADNAITNVLMADNAIGTSEITNGTVANADLANMAANSFKINNTGSPAVPIDGTIAQVKTMLDLSGSNNGDQTITLTGDISGSGTGVIATSINSNAVDGTNIFLSGEGIGDMLVNDGTNYVLLQGNTTSTKKFLNQTGDGFDPGIPTWNALVAADIPNASGGDVTGPLTNLQISSGVVGATELATNAVTNVDVNDVSVAKLTTGTVANGLTLALTNAGTMRVEYPSSSSPAILFDDVNHTTTMFSEDGTQFVSTDDTQTLVGSGTTYMTYIDGVLRLNDSDISNYIAIQPPATGSLTTNYTLTLPVDDGTPDQVLKTNGSGVLSWTTPSGGGGGSVATDAIFDAKGDIAVGTANDAADNLTVGTNGSSLYADSGEATGLRWGKKTITPATITSNENNYNPTDFAKSQIVRISGNTSIWTITSFAATFDGDEKLLINVGTSTIGISPEHPDGTAANRITGIPETYYLMAGEEVGIRYDGTSSRWRLFQKKGFNDSEKTLEFIFVPGSVSAGDFGNITTVMHNSGTVSAAGATNTTPAAMVLSTSTINTAFPVAYFTKSAFTYSSFGGAAQQIKAWVSVATLSDATNTYIFHFQLHTSPSSSTEYSNNQVGIRYTHSENSGKFLGYVRDNLGTETTVDLGVTVVAGQLYDLTIEIDKSLLEAKFFIDGIYAGRVTGDLPGNVSMGSRIAIKKTAGTAARTLSVYKLISRAIY